MTSAAAPPAQGRRTRPLRPVVVAAHLADLTGPGTGRIELPLELFWSAPDREFDLADPDAIRSMYEKVLREARNTSDLAYLNADLLTAVWPALFLPPDVRAAWEQQHKALRRGAAAA